MSETSPASASRKGRVALVVAIERFRLDFVSWLWERSKCERWMNPGVPYLADVGGKSSKVFGRGTSCLENGR